MGKLRKINSSDDLFDQQMPFTPWFMSCYKPNKFGLLYTNLKDPLRTAYVLRMSDHMYVCYRYSVDGVVGLHRVGGPSSYHYNYKSQRLLKLTFHLAGKEYNEVGYWKRLAETGSFYRWKESDEYDLCEVKSIFKNWPNPFVEYYMVNDRDIEYRLKPNSRKLSKYQYYKIFEQRTL